jgi:hypothetical protein
MYFRMVLGLGDLQISTDDQSPVVFEYGGTPQVTVCIGPSQLLLGISADENDPLCVASTNVDVDPRIEEICQHLGDGRLPPGFVLEREKYEANGITRDRRIDPERGVPIQYFPDHFQQFEKDLWHRLYGLAARTVKALRWRLGMHGPRSPFRNSVLQFSVDGQAWRRLPVVEQQAPTARPGLRVPPHIEAEITRLVEQGDSEPIGFELFHEAWTHGTANPRSAVVLAFAAAEVGCKDLIRFLAPDAAWLINNLQSPPLHRLLGQYLPGLPMRTASIGKVYIPSALCNAMDTAADLRNKAVHTGEDVSKEALRKTLAHVRDLLWLFEFYKGHDWAVEHLTAETKGSIEAARR